MYFTLILESPVRYKNYQLFYHRALNPPHSFALVENSVVNLIFVHLKVICLFYLVAINIFSLFLVFCSFTLVGLDIHFFYSYGLGYRDTLVTMTIYLVDCALSKREFQAVQGLSVPGLKLTLISGEWKHHRGHIFRVRGYERR